jgi:hypothetical protein
VKNTTFSFELLEWREFGLTFAPKLWLVDLLAERAPNSSEFTSPNPSRPQEKNYQLEGDTDGLSSDSAQHGTFCTP